MSCLFDDLGLWTLILRARAQHKKRASRHVEVTSRAEYQISSLATTIAPLLLFYHKIEAMAPGREATEFNAIIQADRAKKQKQALADKIFSRRSSAPAAGQLAGGRKPPSGPSSLASRITKVSLAAQSTASSKY